MIENIERCTGLCCQVKTKCQRYTQKSGIYMFDLDMPFEIENGVFKCCYFWSNITGIGTTIRKKMLNA